MNLNCSQLRPLVFAGLLLGILISPVVSQISSEDEPIFSHLRYSRRINAHGDEFMSMDINSEKTRLAIGTEKGDVIIWSLPKNNVERRIHLRRPVHKLRFIDENSVVVAGGGHTGIHSCLFGRVDIRTGRFEEWSGAGTTALIYLSWDPTTKVVAVAPLNGSVSAWDPRVGKRLALWSPAGTILSVAVNSDGILVSLSDYKPNQSDDEQTEIRSEIARYSVAAPSVQQPPFLPKQLGYAVNLSFSPDGNTLAANLSQGDDSEIGFYDSRTRERIASYKGNYRVKWVGPRRFLVSDDEFPLRVGTLGINGEIEMREINKEGGFHGSGTPIGITGQVVSPDERFVWQVYKKLGALARFDLEQKQQELLYVLPPFPYAMDVRERATGTGYMATVGDDNFLRVWDLKDLSVAKEVPTEKTPRGVAVLADGKRVIFSQSSDKAPTTISMLDLVEGSQRVLMHVPEPFVGVLAAGHGFLYPEAQAPTKMPETMRAASTGLVAQKGGTVSDEDEKRVNTLVLMDPDARRVIKRFSFRDGIDVYANSANAEWLAVVDKKGAVWRVNLVKYTQEIISQDRIKNPTRVAITNRGNHVYTTNFYASLTEWDARTGKTREIVDGFRGQASCLKLSSDEKYAVIGGNHFDIGIYEIATGETAFYTRVDASDFYVPHAWMKDNRLVYITDAGVMFDGILGE